MQRELELGVCTLCELPLRELLNERANMGTQNNYFVRKRPFSMGWNGGYGFKNSKKIKHIGLYGSEAEHGCDATEMAAACHDIVACTEQHVQRTLPFGLYVLRAKLFIGHGGGGIIWLCIHARYCKF